MKRLLAIGLLLVFFFNVGGYYLLFWGLRKAAEQQLARQIENNDVDGGRQFEFKIPLTMPYALQETGFVPASGTFEHEGKLYTLIRQKYINDTLHVVCIRDVRQNQLHVALNQYAEQSSDVAAPTGKGIQLTKPSNEFEDNPAAGICSGSCWSVRLGYDELKFSLSSGYLSLYSPPPDDC